MMVHKFRTTDYCMVAPNILGSSLLHLPHAIHLAPRIFYMAACGKSVHPWFKDITETCLMFLKLMSFTPITVF